jgi:hypothetical protein
VLDVLDHPVIAGPYPRRRRGKSARRHGETLTVLRLGLPPTPARTFRSTNAVESMISICRDHASNVKRWRDGQVALRWCAVGTIWAGKQFRRASTAISICASCATRWDASPNLSLPPTWMRTSKPPAHHRAAAEVLQDSGRPLLVPYSLSPTLDAACGCRRHAEAVRISADAAVRGLLDLGRLPVFAERTLADTGPAAAP